jgi:diguanylate cyclase (GGDEF)-like protein
LAAEERSADEVRRCALETVTAITAVLDERERVWTSRLQELKAHADELQGRLNDAEERSTTDNLTDLMNRRGFDMHVGEALAALSAGGSPAAVIMFDVDQFAALKATRGNDVGNAVLQEVANALALSFPRRIAILARHDGGEFAVLMRATGRAEGLRQAERALLRIHCTTIKTPLAKLTVTASAGVTELALGDTSASVVDRALTLLRRARTQGGNRADAAGPAPG